MSKQSDVTVAFTDGEVKTYRIIGEHEHRRLSRGSGRAIRRAVVVQRWPVVGHSPGEHPGLANYACRRRPWRGAGEAMMTPRALDVVTALMTGTRPAYRDIELPRWLYRAVLLTFPLSLPALAVAFLALLLLAIAEAICVYFRDLAAGMWRGGRW